MNALKECRTALEWALQVAVFTLVRVYRLVLSPLLGPSCRYYPSCSRYMEQSIEALGVWRGLAAGTSRLLRCHPWAAGGYDPPPSSFDSAFKPNAELQEGTRLSQSRFGMLAWRTRGACCCGSRGACVTKSNCCGMGVADARASRSL